MRNILAASLLVFGWAPLLGQAPAATSTPAAAPAKTPASAPQTSNSDIGFSYGLPAEWETVPEPPPPAPLPDVIANPKLAIVKKGTACVQVTFTARHGNPASVVVVVALPFACYGQTMTASDLLGFGAGAAEELKEIFEVGANPVQGNYSLGSHSMWIERAKGAPKGHPENQYTFEMVCSVLEKGAVCWMAMAADDASLQAFEQGAVSLDGEPASALVPASALPNKPS
jgi:hypothetical protein